MIYVRRQHRTAVKTTLILAAITSVAIVLGVPAPAVQIQQLDVSQNGQIEFSIASANIVSRAGGYGFFLRGALVQTDS